MSDLADFFDGVAEMRAYLEQHGDRTGRERLKRMAFDLTRPRSFDALASWLCTSLVDALSLRGVALVVHGQVHTCAGVVVSLPTDQALTSARDMSLQGHTFVHLSGGTVIGLNGATHVFGALWLEHERSIDPTVTSLLQAVVDAVAMSLDAVHERSRLTGAV